MKLSNKNKEGISTIIKVLGTGIIYIVLSKIESPIISYLFLAIIIFFWLFNIYDKVLYRLRSKPSEIRFPTQNDSFSKITSLFFGILIILGISLFMYFKQDYSMVHIIGLVIGLIILTNGLLDLPKGCLKIKENSIYLKGANDSIEVSDIELIEIYNETIAITDTSQKRQTVTLLDLDESWTKQIKQMLQKKLTDEMINVKLRKPTY